MTRRKLANQDDAFGRMSRHEKLRLRRASQVKKEGGVQLVDVETGAALVKTIAPTTNVKDTFTVLVKFEIKATSQEEANQAVIGALGLLDNDEDGLTPSQYSVIEESKSPSECTEQRKGGT